MGFFIVEVKSVSHFEMLDRVYRSGQLERLRKAHQYISIHYGEKVYTLLAVVENYKTLYFFEDFLS